MIKLSKNGRIIIVVYTSQKSQDGNVVDSMYKITPSALAVTYWTFHQTRMARIQLAVLQNGPKNCTSTEKN